MLAPPPRPLVDPDSVHAALDEVVCRQLNKRAFQNGDARKGDLAEKLRNLCCLLTGNDLFIKYSLAGVCSLWNGQAEDRQFLTVARGSRCGIRLMCSEVVSFEEATVCANKDQLVALFADHHDDTMVECHAAVNIEWRDACEGIAFGNKRWLPASSWTRGIVAALAVQVHIFSRDAALLLRATWPITPETPAPDVDAPHNSVDEDKGQVREAGQDDSNSFSWDSPMYEDANRERFLNMLTTVLKVHGEEEVALAALIDILTPTLEQHSEWQAQAARGDPPATASADPDASLEELADPAACFVVLILPATSIELLKPGLLEANRDGTVRKGVKLLKEKCLNNPPALSKQLLKLLQASAGSSWGQEAIKAFLNMQLTAARSVDISQKVVDDVCSMAGKHKNTLVLASDGRVFAGGVHVHVKGSGTHGTMSNMAFQVSSYLLEKRLKGGEYLGWGLLEAAGSGLRLYYPVLSPDNRRHLGALKMNRPEWRRP